MTEDPLAEFEDRTELAEPEAFRMPASVLEIPAEDRSLFEQLRSNPKIADISDEIAFNKYLRIVLSREFEKWNAFSHQEMVSAIIAGLLEAKIITEGAERATRKVLAANLPSTGMGASQVRALSKLLETSGKLAEQHKKITEGIRVKVDLAQPDVIQRLFSLVIAPSVPRQYWEAIEVRAREFAPTAGTSLALDFSE